MKSREKEGEKTDKSHPHKQQRKIGLMFEEAFRAGFKLNMNLLCVGKLTH